MYEEVVVNPAVSTEDGCLLSAASVASDWSPAECGGRGGEENGRSCSGYKLEDVPETDGQEDVKDEKLLRLMEDLCVEA